MHHNLVRGMQLTQTSHCAVDANGSPLDIVGQVMITIALGTFVVVHNLTVDCLLGADFMKNHATVLLQIVSIANTLTLGQVYFSSCCQTTYNPHCVRLPVVPTLFGPHRTWRYLLSLYNLLLEPLINPLGTGAMVVLVEPVKTLPHQLEFKPFKQG